MIYKTELDAWIEDENKWLRRAALTVYGRLPIKHLRLLDVSLISAEKLLYDKKDEVRKATSFAIRICAKADSKVVCDFLSTNNPPRYSSATSVLCDVT